MTYSVQIATDTGIAWTDPAKYATPAAAQAHADRIKRNDSLTISVVPSTPACTNNDHPSIDLETLTCHKCGHAIALSEDHDG